MNDQTFYARQALREVLRRLNGAGMTWSPRELYRAARMLGFKVEFNHVAAAAASMCWRKELTISGRRYVVRSLQTDAVEHERETA